MVEAAFIPTPRSWTRLGGTTDTSTWSSPENLLQDAEITGFRNSEAYRITLSEDRKRVELASERALLYAWQHLQQWQADDPTQTPCGCLEDEPEFAVRGFMLDISRCKVPSRDSFARWIDWLTCFRYNQLQLYTEHTFAYTGHENIWQDASPLTPEDIVWLQKRCGERNIELVPNQNCFGHFERWIQHPAYRRFAESPDGFTTPWGTTRSVGSVLKPDEASFELVTGLLDELLPCFSSSQVNIGCDETFELGQGASQGLCDQQGRGKVYTDFLLRIMNHVQTVHQMRPQFWGDILLSHPDQLTRLPQDVLALEWGYEADHPFEKDAATFSQAGLDFVICPGTSSWRSFAGRSQNMRLNIERAAQQARTNGAKGVLLTDWGDCGHLQMEEVSAPALAWCGLQAWNPRNAVFEQAVQWCDRCVFESEGDTGAWLRAGELSEHLGWEPSNSNALFQLFLYPDNHRERIGQIDRKALDQTLDLVANLTPPRNHTESWEQTLRNLKLALFREIGRKTGTHPAPELEKEAVEAHAVLWRQRNREGGLAESLSMYRNTAS